MNTEKLNIKSVINTKSIYKIVFYSKIKEYKINGLDNNQNPIMENSGGTINTFGNITNEDFYTTEEALAWIVNNANGLKRNGDDRFKTEDVALYFQIIETYKIEF